MIRTLLLSSALLCVGLAGCTSPVPSSVPSAAPSVTVTVTTSPTVASSAPPAVCEYGYTNASSVALIISSWDLVKASRGQRDHARMLTSMENQVKAAQEDEEEGCVGSAQLAVLASAIPLVRSLYTAMGEADDDTYMTIVDAGNDWLDAIGHKRFRFSMKPNDIGI